ncbi:MAG: hypothetical protein HFH70_08685 [Lachnospiraceae bacterium]|nr:hypothetical protein [Lachnospiraceae bacterium]
MNFYIQANNPRVLNGYNPEDENLSDAMETIFPLYTESAVMMWNHISIPLSYKYDISYMMDDILYLLEDLSQVNEGKRRICWLPDTFRCDWDIVWGKGQIEITSNWESVTGNLEGLLNANNKIFLKIIEFMSEWKQVLYIVLQGLKNNGYMEDMIINLDKLSEQYEMIPGNGILYQG